VFEDGAAVIEKSGPGIADTVVFGEVLGRSKLSPGKLAVIV
jgi:hypothetical protein